MSNYQELYTIAESMPKGDVPDKLRCPGCDQIMIGAFRLPCCDQQLCERCHAKGPESCVVCGHEPLNCADLKPHRSSRITIKAFLKSEEKKREQKRAHAAAKIEAAAGDTPSVMQPTSNGLHRGSEAATAAALHNAAHEAEAQISASDQSGQEQKQHTKHSLSDGVGSGNTNEEIEAKLDGAVVESAPSSPSSSVEITLDYPDAPPERGFGSRSFSTAHDAMDLHTSANGNQTPAAPDGRRESRVQKPPHAHNKQDDHNEAADGTAFSNFSNFGAFNPMMPMQSGMNPAYYLQMQMMALQSMGIDPMAMSQGQFGGFNGQGFGMNGMNMNMSMNGGFDGNFQAWTAGMNADYGANAGFITPGGYNQQMQQGQVNHMQRAHYHNNYNQNRFRGRGNRRGFGREQQSHPGRSQSNAGMLSNNTDPSTDRRAGHGLQSQNLDTERAGLPSDHAPQGTAHKVGEGSQADSTERLNPVRRMEAQGSQFDQGLAIIDTDVAVRQPDTSHRAVPATDQAQTNGVGRRNSSTAVTLEAGSLGHNRSLDTDNGDYQARLTDRVTLTSDTSDASKAPPAFAVSELKAPGVNGAPTGPKAMREGLPNVGIRVRHGSQATNIANRYSAKSAAAPQTPASDPAPRPSSSSDSTRLPTSSKRGRSPSADRSSKVLRRRSPTAAPEELENVEHRRDRSHRHSRRHSRDRADSPDSAEGHRSRRDRDKHRSSRRDRDRDREHSRDRHRRKHRSRSPARATGASDMSRDEKGSRRVARYREREGHVKDDKRRPILDDPELSRRHRDTREGKDERSARQTKDESRPTAPAAAREFKIKDSSKRKQQETEEKIKSQHADRRKRTEVEVQKEVVRAQNPDIDVYALEREASTRARMLKEQQRLQALKPAPAQANSRKRSSAAMETGNLNGLNAPTGPSADMGGRSSHKRQRFDDNSRSGKSRKSFKYEDDEDADDRASRIEREREAARFR